MNYKRQAFTLIELAIVLVIIGLIAGGVLVGQDLIRASKIRKDINLIEQIDRQVLTFKNKYNCLPGDCPQADAFGLGTGTCSPWVNVNNGDKFIFENGRTIYRSQCVAMNVLNEVFGTQIEPWQGPYVDKNHADYLLYKFPPTYAIPGNLMVSTPFLSSDSSQPFGAAHYQYLGTHSGAFCCEQYNMAWGYTPSDAHFIDTKIDDGTPLTGNVQAANHAFGQVMNELSTPTPAGTDACVSNAAGNPYLLTEDENRCILRVRAKF